MTVTGGYFYDIQVAELARDVRPSARTGFEITELNRIYKKLGKLYVEKMGQGYAWLDMGTYHSLVEASDFVRVMRKCTGTLIACLDETAFHQRFVD